MSSDFLYVSRSPRAPYETASPVREIQLSEWVRLVNADVEFVRVGTYRGYSGEQHCVARWDGHQLPGSPGQFFLWMDGMVVYDDRYMDEPTRRKIVSIALALDAKVYDIEGNEIGAAE